MINAPGFQSYDELQASTWLGRVKNEMSQDKWPNECLRCAQTEKIHGHSIRLHSLQRHKILSSIRSDYLILGGTLDNLCNSACQSCNENLSTKIGSLSSKNYKIVDNSHLLSRVPRDRILEIDLNGGEPTASPRYHYLLHNLPPGVKILRVNTNGSRLLPNIQSILESHLKVIVTLSLDGTGERHDYVRWPIKWSNFCETVLKYRDLSRVFDNLKLQAWTTLHSLNLSDFENIKKYAADNDLEHDWAYLESPTQLDVRFCNSFTQPYKHMSPNIIATKENNQAELDQFINDQDRLRGINIKDYV